MHSAAFAYCKFTGTSFACATSACTFTLLARRDVSVDTWVCVRACVRMIDRNTVSYVSLSFLLQTFHERAKIQRFMRQLTPRWAHHQCSQLTRQTHKHTHTHRLYFLFGVSLCPHICQNISISPNIDAVTFKHWQLRKYILSRVLVQLLGLLY